MTRELPDMNNPTWPNRTGLEYSSEAPPALHEEAPGIPEETLLQETESLLFVLAQAIEQRDPHTARHCERVAFTSVALGMALHLDRPSLSALYRGGYLHDIGKVGIPDAILFKPGRLSAEEWVVMRSHTLRGEEICRHVKSLAKVLPIIRHHHERWDGSGYPDGLRGTQIPLLARVLQTADIYDALTSPRPYKPAYPAKRALQLMAEETKRGWRDPAMMTLFFRLHDGIISQIDEYSLHQAGLPESMQRALGSLDEALHSSEVPLGPANGRTFFPPLQSVPLTGFPEAAKGR